MCHLSSSTGCSLTLRFLQTVVLIVPWCQCLSISYLGRKFDWRLLIEDMKSKLRVLFMEDHSISLPTKSGVKQCWDCAAHAILTRGWNKLIFLHKPILQMKHALLCLCSALWAKKGKRKGVKTCIFLQKLNLRTKLQSVCQYLSSLFGE